MVLDTRKMEQKEQVHQELVVVARKSRMYGLMVFLLFVK